MESATDSLRKMKLRNNLQLRFIISFTVFAMIITGAYTFVMEVFKYRMAEDFFQRRIQAELDYFAEKYQQDPNTPLPIAEDIQSYLGTDKMPKSTQLLVKSKIDGVYDAELNTDDYYDELENRNTDTSWGYNDRMVEPFFGIKTLHDQKKIYIFIDFEFWHQREHELLIPTFLGYIVVMIVALIIGWYTANRVIKPLKRLVKVVENSDPNNISTGFAKIFKEDEIGALARAFEASLRRIQKFIKREYQFTRDASHELRTPVTVIKGAVELLKMSTACEDTMTDKLVQRIERSTRDMETTIESLLWLAKEPNATEYGINTDLLPLIENAIEQNKHLLSGKEVEIDLQVEVTPLVKAPTGVLAIAISNLIRNACQFTTKGSITVTLQKNRIDVEDTGIGICQEDLEHVKKPDVSGSSSDGFGFGLDIVNRLCSRFDWRLNIESIQGKGTKTSLIFH